MTDLEFFNACRYHDWYYAQSDDIEVYNNGIEAKERLIAESQTSELKARIYMSWHKHHFSGPNWKVGTIQSPRPTYTEFGLPEPEPTPPVDRSKLHSSFRPDIGFSFA